MNTWNFKNSIIDKIKNLDDSNLYIQNIFNEIILSIDDKAKQFLEKYKNNQEIMALINARAEGMGTKLPAMDSQDEQNCYLRIEELLKNIEKLYEGFSERWWFAHLGRINKLLEESILGNFIRKEPIIKRNGEIINQLLNKGNYEIADFYLEKLSPDKKTSTIKYAAIDKNSGKLILHFLSKYDFFDDMENQGALLNKIIKKDINDFNQIIDMAVEARKKQINKKIFNFIEDFFFYNKAEGKRVDLEYVYKNGFFMNVDNRYLHNGNYWTVGNIFCNTLAEKEIVLKYLPDMSENVRKAHIKLLINSGEFSIIKKVIENYDVDPYTNFGGFTHINYFLVGKIIEGGVNF